MNTEEQLIELIRKVSDLSAKIDGIQETLDNTKTIQTTVVTHDNRIEQMALSLQRGEQRFLKIDEKFDKLEGRIDSLEEREGEKAKYIIRTAGQYIALTLLGVILSQIPILIRSILK